MMHASLFPVFTLQHMCYHVDVTRPRWLNIPGLTQRNTASLLNKLAKISRNVGLAGALLAKERKEWVKESKQE
jgi:hypothetical protein